MNIKEQVFNVLKQINEESGINADVSLDTDLTIGNIYDSFAIINIITQVEEVTNISLIDNMSEILQIKNVGDFISYIEDLSSK